jgi:D-alanyl-D-alanine carboxypeptidase (penicillin-binding protein 5/6)
MKSTVERVFSYLLSAGLGGAILVLGLSMVYQQAESEAALQEQKEWPTPFELDATLLTGTAAAVYDPAGKQFLYAKNADLVLPLASLTKLVSAYAVLSYKNPDELVTITPSAMTPEGDWGFFVGERWPVKELIHFALGVSSNDAIQAATESLGPDYIGVVNEQARSLGLNEINVLNPTGLDVSLTAAGGFGSARDIALLTADFMQEYPTYFEATTAPSVTITYGLRTLTATSTALPLIEIPGLIGAKTGYTDLAGGNLVAAFDLELGRPLIIAVLGSTLNGRFEDVKRLIEAARRK